MITWVDVVEPCWCCGQPRTVRKFTDYPRLVVPPREETRASAETPSAFGTTTEHSDNLATRERP